MIINNVSSFIREIPLYGVYDNPEPQLRNSRELISIYIFTNFPIWKDIDFQCCKKQPKVQI